MSRRHGSIEFEKVASSSDPNLSAQARPPSDSDRTQRDTDHSCSRPAGGATSSLGGSWPISPSPHAAYSENTVATSMPLCCNSLTSIPPVYGQLASRTTTCESNGKTALQGSSSGRDSRPLAAAAAAANSVLRLANKRHLITTDDRAKCHKHTKRQFRQREKKPEEDMDDEGMVFSEEEEEGSCRGEEMLRRECDKYKESEKMLTRELSLAKLEVEKYKGMARAALCRAAKARSRFEEEAERAQRLEDDMVEELTIAHTELRRKSSELKRVSLGGSVRDPSPAMLTQLEIAGDLAKAERAVSLALMAESAREKEKLRRLDWVRSEDAQSYECNLKQLEVGLKGALGRIVELEVSNAHLKTRANRAEEDERATLEREKKLSAQLNSLKSIIQADLITSTSAAAARKKNHLPRKEEEDYFLIHPTRPPRSPRGRDLDEKTKTPPFSWSAMASFLACIDSEHYQ